MADEDEEARRRRLSEEANRVINEAGGRRDVSGRKIEGPAVREPPLKSDAVIQNEALEAKRTAEGAQSAKMHEELAKLNAQIEREKYRQSLEAEKQRIAAAQKATYESKAKTYEEKLKTIESRVGSNPLAWAAGKVLGHGERTTTEVTEGGRTYRIKEGGSGLIGAYEGYKRWKEEKEAKKLEQQQKQTELENKRLSGHLKAVQAESAAALARQRASATRVREQVGEVNVEKQRYMLEQLREKESPGLAMTPPGESGLLAAQPPRGMLDAAPPSGGGLMGGGGGLGGLGGGYIHVSPPVSAPSGSGPIAAPQGPVPDDSVSKLTMNRNNDVLERLSGSSGSGFDNLTRPNQSGFERLTRPSGDGFANLARPTGINLQQKKQGGGFENFNLKGPAKFQNSFGEGWKKLALRR